MKSALRFFLLSGCFLSAVFQTPGWAADKPPEAKTTFAMADFSPDGGELDTEALLKTVNDTLKENRDIRKTMKSMQEAIERMTLENNVLKSRMRTAEGRAIQKDKEKKATAEEVKLRQEQIGALRAKNLEQLSSLAAQSKKLADAQAEIAALKAKLGKTILESEREVFTSKLEDLQKRSDDAVRAMAAANSQSALLQEELGESYYRMGNIRFEQREFEGAAEFYQKALHFNPQLSYAHHNLAVIFDYYLNDNPKALEHYRRYLALEPDEADINLIRERMLMLKLQKNIVPQMPLKLDFNKNHRKNN